MKFKELDIGDQVKIKNSNLTGIITGMCDHLPTRWNFFSRKKRHDPTRWYFRIELPDGTTVWKNKYQLELK